MDEVINNNDWENKPVETDSAKDFGEEVFSKRVRAGKRTYFIDVKRTRRVRDLYITITESKRVGDVEYEKHKIFLYKEDIDKFLEAFTETIDFVRADTEKAAQPSQDTEKV